MWILIAFLVLAKCAYDDIQTRYINLYILGIGLVFAIIFSFLCHENINIKSVVIGMIPGLLLLVITHIFKGIGKGDAFVFIFTGIMCGYYDVIKIILFSFTISFIYAFFLLAIKRVDKNYSYPFVPFILSGFIICEIINIYQGVLL